MTVSRTLVDECRDRLHRAGGSVGDAGSALGWLVTGANGENAIKAEGGTHNEACHRPAEQAGSAEPSQQASLFSCPSPPARRQSAPEAATRPIAECRP